MVADISPTQQTPNALYGVELWWKSQENHEQTIQQLLNRQARSITEMYPSTPIHPLLSEAGLIPAQILLDNRQRMYAYRLLTLPDQHAAKTILPISLRNRDRNSQPREQPTDTLLWTKITRPAPYGQWLAWQIALDHAIDPAEGVEPVKLVDCIAKFEEQLVIESPKDALEKAKKMTEA